MSKNHLLCVALFCAAGCATRPEPVSNVAARAFTISSESGTFLMRGRFNGTVEVLRDEVVVAVKDGLVLSRTEALTNVKLRALIAGPGKAGVAEIIAHSRPRPVAIGAFAMGESRALTSPITFRIPMPRKFDPANQWLVIEFILKEGITTYACETGNLEGPVSSGAKRIGSVCWASPTH